MSYKEEYEVARLYATRDWRAMIEAEFENVQGMKLLLAPPLLSRVDPATGRPRKIAFGRWIFPVLRGLARFRGLRGTMFDPLGQTAERRPERALTAEVAAAVEMIARTLTAQSRAACLAYLSAVDQIRGFGPVKEKALTEFHARQAGLLAAIQSYRRQSPNLQAWRCG